MSGPRISDVPRNRVVDDRDELDTGRLGLAARVDDHLLELCHLLGVLLALPDAYVDDRAVGRCACVVTEKSVQPGDGGDQVAARLIGHALDLGEAGRIEVAAGYADHGSAWDRGGHLDASGLLFIYVPIDYRNVNELEEGPVPGPRPNDAAVPDGEAGPGTHETRTRGRGGQGDAGPAAWPPTEPSGRRSH